MGHIKNIFLSILFVFISKGIFSQTLKDSKVGITVGTGYNTQVKAKDKFFSPSFYYQNRFSPYFGLIYRDTLSKTFSIKTSLYYIQRGIRFNYKYETPFYNLYADQKFTCHYISFPIKINFNIKNFFIGAGVEGSILLKGHYDSNIEENDPTTGYTNKNRLNKWYGEQYFEPVDAGYNFSLGYKHKRFEVEFSIFHGLIIPPKFFIFTSQHFEFQYLYQQTFMLGINYFPTFKRHVKIRS